MSTITIELPDELSDLVAEAGERLPELLAQSLRQPPLPVHVYRYVLDFLASNPSAEQIASFAPTPEMAERLRMLLARETANNITPTEKAELEEYERLEHLMVMIKAGMLRNLAHAS
jgi:hypothetical protein